ncbi:MAG: cytochrome P450 [Anaerolineae bacterium]
MPPFDMVRSGIAFLNAPIRLMGEQFGRYGLIAPMARAPSYSPLSGFRITFLYGPEYNRQLITQHDVFHKLPLAETLFPPWHNGRREPLGRFMGGLFHVNGDEHRRHRRLLMPAFHKQHIAAYHDDMVRLTLEMLDEWQVGQPVDVQEEMRQLTMRIALKTLFGEEALSDQTAVGHALQDAMVLVLRPFTIVLPVDVPGVPFHRFLTRINQVDSAIRTMIAERRRSGAHGVDMLSMLIRAQDEDGTGLTDNDVIGHAEVIFGAGHETSAAALTWTLLLLAQHPAVLADLMDELASVLRGSPPTLADLERLTFLDHVIKESMRVIPPVPMNARTAAQPTEIGYVTIEPGEQVIASIYHTHHMPDLFANPEDFTPMRWETLKPDPFAYNPFSAGPRMCIGAAYATMELKVVLACLLQRFRLGILPGTRADR